MLYSTHTEPGKYFLPTALAVWPRHWSLQFFSWRFLSSYVLLHFDATCTVLLIATSWGGTSSH